MSLRIIRVKPESNQRFFVTLDGRLYGFRLRFNPRAAAWYLDVSNSRGQVVVAGVRVRRLYPLLMQYVGYASLPQGTLFIGEDAITFAGLTGIGYTEKGR